MKKENIHSCFFSIGGLIGGLGWSCLRCGHAWLPRQTDKPIVCPKCKSPWWDIPKKEKKEEDV